VISSLHCFDLSLKLGLTTRAHRGDLLVGNNNLLTVDAFTETHSVLACPHDVVIWSVINS